MGSRKSAVIGCRRYGGIEKMGITIVGVGPAEGYLTDRAKEIISRADVVFGSVRALRLAEEYIRGEKVELNRFDRGEMERVVRAGARKEAVVLSTGDPMVSGLGKLVRGKVEPGISSVQLALARLGVDLCEVVVVDAHARDSHQEVLRATEFRNRILILADKKFNLGRLVEMGRSKGVNVTKLVVLTNLGMEDEEVVEVNAAEGLRPETVASVTIKSDLAIVYVEAVRAGSGESNSEASSEVET